MIPEPDPGRPEAPASPGRLEFRAERADASPGRELLAAMVAHLADLYGPENEAGTPSAHPEELASPGGAFLVLYEDGEPVACGGVKRLADGVGEIKRMYVVPAARSRGHARRLLDALEAASAGLGYRRVRLDTGHLQPHARALYRSAGYEPIPDYNGNPFASHWFEKGLPAAEA